MSQLRFLTAGESHGPALVGVLEGMPAGVPFSSALIDAQLARRQKGYGRGGRMLIEKDKVQVLSGVRFSETLGSPIALMIENKDFPHWVKRMAIEGPEEGPAFTRPRPGHADLVGVQKFDRTDARDILERASARETTMRVAVGSICRQLLEQFGIQIASQVMSMGDVATTHLLQPEDLERVEASPVRTSDAEKEAGMIAAVDAAKAAGDTLGGVFEVVVWGLPPGLGSHTHWDRKLDGRIAQSMMSIQAIKGVEVGDAFWGAGQRGSAVHDPIAFDTGRGFYRTSNRAGGLEGGITNGEALRVRCAMKPLSTLKRPLPSVDFRTKEPFMAQVERSDVTAVPAAGVVGEAMAALAVAEVLLEKFGADALSDMKAAFDAYRARMNR